MEEEEQRVYSTRRDRYEQLDSSVGKLTITVSQLMIILGGLVGLIGTGFTVYSSYEKAVSATELKHAKYDATLDRIQEQINSMYKDLQQTQQSIDNHERNVTHKGVK